MTRHYQPYIDRTESVLKTATDDCTCIFDYDYTAFQESRQCRPLESVSPCLLIRHIFSTLFIFARFRWVMSGATLESRAFSLIQRRSSRTSTAFTPSSLPAEYGLLRWLRRAYAAVYADARELHAAIDYDDVIIFTMTLRRSAMPLSRRCARHAMLSLEHAVAATAVAGIDVTFRERRQLAPPLPRRAASPVAISLTIFLAICRRNAIRPAMGR